MSNNADYWSNRYAGVIRDQWDQWEQDFKPYEQHYAQLVTDPAKRAAMRAQSMGYVNQSADASHARGLQSLANRDAKYGVGLGALELKSRERKMGAGLAALKAKGMTDMAGYMKDREMQMMSGGVSYNPIQQQENR